ncbi:MAG TPA: hypothetical protein VFV38_22680 [Ktedonobacteraceae bacterium]|nr:hypothetical protein [Ktedonobacteraceae bacterium]
MSDATTSRFLVGETSRWTKELVAMLAKRGTPWVGTMDDPKGFLPDTPRPQRHGGSSFTQPACPSPLQPDG